jgi:fatty-acid desaturase
MLIGLLAFFVATTLLGLGNTVGYHRLLTHRSFGVPGFVRDGLTLLGATHSGSPLLWVGLHRLHHAKSDGPLDPHTPTKGFWYGHCGWILGLSHPVPCWLFAMSGFGQQATFWVHDLRRIMGMNPPEWRELCPDLRGLPLMRLLDTPLVMPLGFVMQLALCFWVGGWWGVLWLWAVHAVLTNGSWAVNSVCHWPGFGREDYPNRDQSRNVPWLSLLTYGEAYHNNHHRYPRSAWHALGSGYDLSWAVIRLMARLGLAKDLWLPKKFRDNRR